MVAKVKNNSRKQAKLDKPTNYKKYIIIGGALLITIILFFMYIAFERYQLYRAEKTIDSIANELNIALPDLGQPNKEKYCTYPSTKMPTIGRKPSCTVVLKYNINKFDQKTLNSDSNTIYKAVLEIQSINNAQIYNDSDKIFIEFNPSGSIGVKCNTVIGNNLENGVVEVSCSKKTLFEYFKSKE